MDCDFWIKEYLKNAKKQQPWQLCYTLKKFKNFPKNGTSQISTSGLCTNFLFLVMDVVGTTIPALNAGSVLVIIPSYRRYLCGLRTKTAVITTNLSQSQMNSQLPSTRQESSPQKSPIVNSKQNECEHFWLFIVHFIIVIIFICTFD